MLAKTHGMQGAMGYYGADRPPLLSPLPRMPFAADGATAPHMPIPTFTTLGAGPVVLMLHDADGGHLTFAPQVETLASAGYRAVAWDMPGYGNSAPIEPMNFKGLANRCVALIEALQAPSVALVGHGMGGMVAQEVAMRRPDLVRSLALCASVATWSPQAHARWAVPRLEALATDMRMARHTGQWVPGAIGTAALPEGVRLAGHAMAQVSAATYRRALEALEYFDREGALAQLAAPTLLLAGAQDRFAPPEAMRAMASRIVDCRYVELADVGHWPQLEAPEAFDLALLGFLGERRVLH
jgi:pimeloyl-ACP methyl ester carboxylesterase